MRRILIVTLFISLLFGSSIDKKIRLPNGLWYGLMDDQRYEGEKDYQLKISDYVADTVFSGDTLQTILKALLPINGYLSDVLTGIAIKNFAGPEADLHLENLKLWICDQLPVIMEKKIVSMEKEKLLRPC